MKRSNLRIAVFASAMTCVALGLAGCGVQGTYKDPTGAVTLELKRDWTWDGFVQPVPSTSTPGSSRVRPSGSTSSSPPTGKRVAR
jgi:hypothetical protein